MANTYTDLLKLRMPALGDIGWDDEVNDNVKIAEFVLGAILKSNVVISGLAPSDGGGLDIDYTAGSVVVAGTQHAIGSGSKTCTSGVKNWLFVDDAGTVQISTDPPVGDYVALALIDAAGAALERIADARNFAEGALTIGITYNPDNYLPDTGETGAINQHLAGIDSTLSLLAGLDDKIINGNFDIWQRAFSQTSSGYGSDDRWKNTNIVTTKTNSRQSFTIGQTDVPNNPKYYCRIVVNSSAGAENFCSKQQRIESVYTLAGKTATLTFYAKADSTKNIAVEFNQFFGTGGSPSAIINNIGTTTVNLTTAWQKFIITVNFPSIAGKTLGTDANDYLGVNFWFDAGSDYDSRTNSLGQQSGTFDIAQISLIEGSNSMEHKPLPAWATLLLCLRYYEDSGTVGSCQIWDGETISGSTRAIRTRFTMTKRIAAVVTLSNAQNSNFPATPGTPSANEWGFQESRSATATSGRGYYSSTWTADAEL
jgi:hypothetical protein